MKLTLTILFILALVIIVLLFIYGKDSQKGKSPGLVDGALSQCSKKPNCVCSEIEKDEQHYISPISISSTDSIPIINSIIENMGGVLYLEKENYFAYHFTSTFFGFVDDFEIRYDLSDKVIHIRSASRVGTSDFGVNRKRIELLKSLYQQRLQNI